MLDRDAFDRIGGFSPAFFMYFEDADLCARHRCAEGEVALDRELLISHGSGRSTEEARRTSLGASLDSINRLSGRRFAARYGRPWHRAVLYLLLVLAYAPRRTLVHLGRERQSLREGLDYVACLLLPRRALRRLGAHRLDVSSVAAAAPPEPAGVASAGERA
jgi:GT2 family glycosyltransferase